MDSFFTYRRKHNQIWNRSSCLHSPVRIFFVFWIFSISPLFWSENPHFSPFTPKNNVLLAINFYVSVQMQPNLAHLFTFSRYTFFVSLIFSILPLFWSKNHHFSLFTPENDVLLAINFHLWIQTQPKLVQEFMLRLWVQFSMFFWYFQFYPFSWVKTLI